jgi:two-component system, NarL family, sensor kinase
MTTVSVAVAADTPLGRLGRVAARTVIVCCALVFAVGLVLWARDDRFTAMMWLFPDVWSVAGLRGAARDLGVPMSSVSSYYMLLEVLAALAGIVAAVLLLRGATSWFRVYAAVAVALWVTLGGTMSVVYGAALAGPAGWVPEVLQGVGWVTVFPLAYLFPDGRFVPRWTRWAAVGWAAYLPALAVLPLFGHETEPQSPVETLPLLVLFGTCVLAAVHRYRHVSTPEQRVQTRGVVAALGLWFVVVLLSFAPPLRDLLEQVSAAGLVANAALQLCSYLVVAMLPASIAVAVLRYRLYEVEVWVNRALVYSALTAMVVVSYGLLATLAGLAWDSNDLGGPLAATVVIAIVFHPLRLRVQRWIDRFVYGRRKEPYAVLADLGRRLEHVLPPDEVLQTLVQQVGETLRLGYVAARHGSVAVVWPDPSSTPTDSVEEFPLRWQDADLGVLVVAARQGDELSTSDRDLLDGLARQAGASVRAAILNDDLHRSRERVLGAREDERRRLQRDLHDGLGPTLAGLFQRVDAARSLLTRDPAAADRLLADVADETRSVIGEIRTLVRALRPPELDELGLAGAIEAIGARLPGLRVDVVAGDLPDLAPAIEASAYRIAVEALTNAARHSGASSAMVRLDLTDASVVLAILDQGRGIATDAAAGTGSRSMRERAEEVGGSCEMTATPNGGTCVRAILPLGRFT